MEKTNKSLICEAMAAIMGDIAAIGKNKTNPQQGYKFRGIDDMYNSLQPLFKKNNVFILSNVLSSKREERQTRSGGTLIYTIALCEFKFYTVDGSFVSSTLEGEAMDSGDKSTNKAMSTALKYALMQTFLIPTEEVIDTEYATHTVAAVSKPAVEKKAEKTAENKQVVKQENEVDLLVRKTYETKEDLLMVLDTCDTVQQLNNLYHCNPKLVSDINIRQSFTNKKDAITKN